MKSYISKGDGTLQLKDSISVNDDLIKVKVASVIPTYFDYAHFTGRMANLKEMILGQIGTGVLSQDVPELDLHRGDKVILNPYIKTDADSGITKRMGIDVDGFFADFIHMPIENIMPYPENVKEQEAIFAPFIAVAQCILTELHVKKGEYIALIGASILNNIVAQLAIYYQAIPIVIDTNNESLELCEECGVYYTIDEKECDPVKKVFDITGGRMCEHTVIHAKGCRNTYLLFALAKEYGNCIIAGLNNYLSKLDADVSMIATKSLNVKGVTSGENDFFTAVNIIAQKVLKLPILIQNEEKFENLEKVLHDFDSYSLQNHCVLIKL